MALTVELACTKSAMVWEKNPNENYSGQSSYELYAASNDGRKRLYLEFETLPAALQNYAILRSQFKISFSSAEKPYHMSFRVISGSFNASEITWDTQPTSTLSGGNGTSGDTTTYSLPSYLDSDNDSRGQRVRFPCVYLEPVSSIFDSSYIADISTAKLVVTYDPSITVAPRLDVAKRFGLYGNPRKALQIYWMLRDPGRQSYTSVGGFTQVSASLFWREGTSGAYTEIQASGSEQSVTIPANTLPVAETIQYYVVCTDNSGTTNTSTVSYFTTTDSAITATPTAPVGTVEDGSGPVILKWDITSPNGTRPTRIDIDWKHVDDAGWTYILNLDGGLKQYTIPAGTFPAGKIYWAVRAYNADATAGSWTTVSFVCVAAPSEPSVSTDGAPFATFDWQSDGQQAWRLTVDGKLYGPRFGTDKSFTLPDYLADGEHVASVEVQGQYGLWSQPGTISFTVANTPGDAIALQGSFGVDAELAWETESAAADFLVYRDGVQIGHTAGFTFTDRFTLGEHAWQVINRLANGNYTASNTVTGTCRSCVTRVSPLAGGDWLALPLSERSSAEQKFQYARKYSLRHVMGAALPVLELSPYEDGSGSYEAAFRTVPEAKAFEALRGKVVIIKSRGGQLLVGALTDVTTRMTNFYIAADFTVQRCHWEDYVDDEND